MGREKLVGSHDANNASHTCVTKTNNLHRNPVGLRPRRSERCHRKLHTRQPRNMKLATATQQRTVRATSGRVRNIAASYGANRHEHNSQGFTPQPCDQACHCLHASTPRQGGEREMASDGVDGRQMQTMAIGAQVPKALLLIAPKRGAQAGSHSNLGVATHTHSCAPLHDALQPCAERDDAS